MLARAACLSIHAVRSWQKISSRWFVKRIPAVTRFPNGTTVIECARICRTRWDITSIASSRCAPRWASGEGRRYYDLSRVRGPGGAAPLLRWLLRPVLLRLRADHERRVRAPNRCVDRWPYSEQVYIGKTAQPAE